LLKGEILKVPTPITEQPPVKRGRGRPPGKDANGVSSNERLLPAPPRFSIQDFQQFVKYWLELVPEHRTRVTVHVYRHWPVIDRKKVDEKANTSIEVFPGENPPFEAARDWEDTLLRLYGSGDYMFWLNEMGKTVCKGFARPRRDMENYPPLVELSELVDDDPTNKSYVDYLRKRNLYTPAMLNAKQTEEDMATNEALQSAIQSANEMAHLAVSTSARQNVPVPPANQDRLIETLVKPMMSMMEKSTEQAVAMVKQQNSGSDPLAVVEMVLKMQAQNSVTAAQSSKPLEIMLQQMATQNAALLERLLNKEAAASTPPPQKTVLEQLRELKEMKELLRDDDGDNDGDGHKSKNNGAGIGGMIIEALPALTNLGLGLWGQFNQTLAYTAMIKNGQTPQAALPQQQPNAAPQTTTTQSPDPAGTMPPQTNGAPPPAPSGPPLNPETGLPYTEAETENLRALAAQYAPLHPVIEAMRPTIVECIANPDKDGYDVAEWFLEQHGRAFYNQIKIQATTEKLYDAMRSYAPLWSQIGQRAEDVKELARQFLHFDEDEIDEVGTGDEGVKPEVLPN
jgi:hypothetical protein